MKEKKKNIILARVGAMVAAVLLVVLCALPVLADEGQESVAPTDYKERLIAQYGMTDADPLYYIISQENYNPYNHPYMYQFKAAEVGHVLDFGRYISYNGRGLYWTATRTRAMVDGQLYVFGDGWWETSHTTLSGSKFVYFDYHEDYAGDSRRAFRIRLKIEPTTLEVLDAYVASDYYDNLKGDASRVLFATATSHAGNLIVPYALDNGMFHAYYDIDYGQFVANFRKSYDSGYYAGYDYAFDWAAEIEYNRGYNDGMSQTSLIDGVTAIFRAPMDLIDGVLNFEIFGINMAVAVRVLITMAIVALCVTVVWKAVK